LDKRWAFCILSPSREWKTFIPFILFFSIMIKIVQQCWSIFSGWGCFGCNFKYWSFLTYAKRWSLFRICWWNVIKAIWWLWGFNSFIFDITAWIKSFGFTERELKFRNRIVHRIKENLLCTWSMLINFLHDE
jgi:hypothetical protein